MSDEAPSPLPQSANTANRFTTRTDDRLLLNDTRSAMQGRYIPDLYDLCHLYDLAHVAGWERYNQHHLGHVSWVGSVPYRSCTISYNGRLGSR